MSANEAVRIKVPFWRTVGSAYLNVLTQLGAVIRLTWPWFLLHAVAMVAFWYAWWPYGSNVEAFSLNKLLVELLVPILIGLIPAAAIAVSIHRLIIRGKASGPIFDRTMPMYALLLAVWWAFSLLPLSPFMLFELPAEPATQTEPLPSEPEPAPEEPDTGSTEVPDLSAVLFAATVIGIWGIGAATMLLLISAAISYVPIRLCLVLPAIALGEDPSLRLAWQRSRGNFWRLFLGSILVTILPFLAFHLPFVFQATDTRASYVAMNSYIEIAVLIGAVFGIAFLSLAYRHLADDNDRRG